MQRPAEKGPYPLGSYVTGPEREPLGFTLRDSLQVTENSPGIMAEWTGEYRQPKEGEWYLSGSIVHAYRATHDYQSPYFIARLVRVRKEARLVVEREN